MLFRSRDVERQDDQVGPFLRSVYHWELTSGAQSSIIPGLVPKGSWNLVYDDTRMLPLGATGCSQSDNGSAITPIPAGTGVFSNYGPIGAAGPVPGANGTTVTPAGAAITPVGFGGPGQTCRQGPDSDDHRLDRGRPGPLPRAVVRQAGTPSPCPQCLGGRPGRVEKRGEDRSTTVSTITLPRRSGPDAASRCSSTRVTPDHGAGYAGRGSTPSTTTAAPSSCRTASSTDRCSPRPSPCWRTTSATAPPSIRPRSRIEQLLDA